MTKGKKKRVWVQERQKVHKRRDSGNIRENKAASGKQNRKKYK